jgi:hypothetical protein
VFLKSKRSQGDFCYIKYLVKGIEICKNLNGMLIKYVERYISERYAAYQERGARLTQDDVDFATPYLPQVNVSAEESEFIAYARKQLLKPMH